MSKIQRYQGDVRAFASAQQSGERYIFGDTTTESDSLSDQLTTDYLRGWAVISASDEPPLEWFNAVAFTATQFISYLHQSGIPEWDGEQEYHRGSQANFNGQIYTCLTDNHTSVTTPNTDPTNWKKASAGDADNADKLDGQHGLFYRDASNLNTGTVPTARLPEATATSKGVSRQATAQEVTDGADVDAYVPPDLLASEIQSSTTLVSVKTDYDKPALEVSGSDLQASQDFSIIINNKRVDVAARETVTPPTLSNATDYKVYAAADGTLSAHEYDTSAPANSALIGGFHAAYSDASINPHSIWDFAWKPATGSPRAMALSLSERVWADIYLMDIDYGINGHSRPDAQIADDSSTPKRALKYGGDGSATYSSFTQYVAKEMAAAAGKRLPNYDEFSDVAYGTVTGQASGIDPVTTKYLAGLRSAIGLEQATGAIWQWGQENWDRGNGSSGYSWYVEGTNGGGQVFTAGASGVGASRFGGGRNESGQSGPRCSNWRGEPWNSGRNGARAVSDHTKYGV